MSVPEEIGERTADGARTLRIWDLPTRAMHWLLALSIAVCWWTGIHNQLEYHLYSGYAALWIVLMLYWGVVGSSTAASSTSCAGPGRYRLCATLHRRAQPVTDTMRWARSACC